VTGASSVGPTAIGGPRPAGVKYRARRETVLRTDFGHAVPQRVDVLTRIAKEESLVATRRTWIFKAFDKKDWRLSPV
jgi:hypothetical protein